MKNKFFTILLTGFFAIVFLFIVSPLLMLIIKGISYVPICLKSVEVQYAITLSIKTSLISTIVCLLLAIPVAYFLHITKLPFKKLIIQIINLPMSLPHLVSGIALLLLFGRMGIGDSIYKILKLDFVFTKQGIILAQVFVNLPLTIKILHTSLNESNEKMIFVARTLGCNSWEAFRFIILPNLKTGIISATVMTWSRALGEFGAVAMIAGSTRMKTEIIPTSIYLNMSTGDIDIAIGIAVILIFISLTCLMLFEIFFNRGVDEYFVLLGASGSGKTLFLETLAG
ncbi:ABC transporter permease, partial [Clostridioides difficile]|uniref:ABC transporter permease n=1 Tax=Clostridioides difficile TaxID=1496 RepID=UPI001F40932E